MVSDKQNKSRSVLFLIFYDLLIFFATNISYLFYYKARDSRFHYEYRDMAVFIGLLFVCTLIFRLVFRVYKQIWRYGGVKSYITLLASDSIAFVCFFLIQKLFFNVCFDCSVLPLPDAITMFSVQLLLCLVMRMLYRYAYKCNSGASKIANIIIVLIKIFSLGKINLSAADEAKKIKVAIIGAGRVGTALANELISNVSSNYIPRCFVDVNSEKIGRRIYGVSVISEKDDVLKKLHELEVQEIVFAIPGISMEHKKELYDFYHSNGYKVKVYDFPIIQAASGSGRRYLREFDISELLFRAPLDVIDNNTVSYYSGKTILVTGGGGSIGSELCRQLARMKPGKLVILDIYENCAYDVQQELRIAYKNEIDICVEICSVCNRTALERVFDEYRPDIVVNAAAHKHVPLMEKNCIEAVENNVFGTLNTVLVSEKYGVKRLIMVSTDKAVNPTNVMGATKRMCEMIVLAHSRAGSGTTYSATRFGNVLGSAGSVVPLFKNQIANGGPITLTDKRIVRYFMTIPEASKLVLKSGAIAQNGELFVLDMGKPVKILDLAENMIRLSGFVPYKDIDIIETGLRPGEKLYEELLVKSETLTKSSDNMIFSEKDIPPTLQEIDEKLAILKRAIESGSDEETRRALMEVVPTFRPAAEVNAEATEKEMKGE